MRGNECEIKRERERGNNTLLSLHHTRPAIIVVAMWKRVVGEISKCLELDGQACSIINPKVACKAEPLTTNTADGPQVLARHRPCTSWAEARVKIARMTLTIKLDGNWSSFQLANNTPPLSVTGSVIAPSARMAQARLPMGPHAYHPGVVLSLPPPNMQPAMPTPQQKSRQQGDTVAMPPASCTVELLTGDVPCHSSVNGPLSCIAPQKSFHQRQELSWPFVSWAMEPHHHGPELGRFCLRVSSVITIEVILCKYSRRSCMPPLGAICRGMLYKLVFAT